MSRKRISVDIPSINQAYLKIMTDLEIDLENLAQLAFEEFVEWIVGIERPTTLSELSVDRLYKIFTRASTPAYFREENLILKLRFPVGRARYLFSTVRKKYPKVVRPVIEKFINEIKQATPRDGYFTLKIFQEYAYVFGAIAKKEEWNMEQLSFRKIGIGQLEVAVIARLKNELVDDLKEYL